MNNSINPVNPMMQDMVDPQDYAKTSDVVILCDEFTRAVMDDFAAQGRLPDLAKEMTQDEAAELQFIDYYIGTMPAGNDKEVAEIGIVAITLSDIFAEIVSRVEPDDDKIARHVPPAMATQDTVDFLEKYQMYALADYARHAIP